MCLILVAWQVDPAFPLVVAANRDEFYARPSLPLGPWDDCPDILAGRDLEAGGTWLGVDRRGRFAAVTNVREPGRPPGERSRGALTAEFLRGDRPPLPYLNDLAGERYAGYNLLVADGETLAYHSNRGGPPSCLAPGIYGLSNHLLDSPWPKLRTAKATFTEALTDPEACFALLADATLVADADLPKTGVSLEWERLLSAIFVRSPTYGTRASTVLRRDRQGRWQGEERGFGANGTPLPPPLQSSLISTVV